jgi:predicted MFS family arabinose efflux permease
VALPSGVWLAENMGYAVVIVITAGLLTAAAGITLLIWLAIPAALLAGMCLFGIGFGICENVTFAMMIERVPASGYGIASALWNLAYGAGPAGFGAFVGYTGYPAAFALTGMLMFVALLPAVRDRTAFTLGP